MVAVPCWPLPNIMARHGLGRANFLSLDVEGAEAIVLETVDVASFDVVLVETDGIDKAKDLRVHELLTRGGHRQSSLLRMPRNQVYIRKDAAITELPIQPQHGGEELARANFSPQMLPSAPKHPNTTEFQAYVARAAKLAHVC